MRALLSESLEKVPEDIHKEIAATLEKYDAMMVAQTEKILAIQLQMADELRRLLDKGKIQSPPLPVVSPDHGTHLEAPPMPAVEKEKIVPARVYQRRIDHIYKKNVLSKSAMSKEEIGDGLALDLCDFLVYEYNFVQCLQPSGWMDSCILDLQCHLWSKEWHDKIILTQGAVVSTN